MSKISKMLNMNKPEIYAYTVYGFLFSLIDEKDMGWIYSNFIQIMYNEDWRMTVFEVHSNILYKCPFLQSYAHDFNGDEQKLIQSIIEAIDNDYYCQLFLDWFYVNENYQGDHFAHPAIITGYDVNLEVFFVYDNFDNGKFTMKQVKFHTVFKAYSMANKSSVGTVKDNAYSDNFRYLRELTYIRYNKYVYTQIDYLELLSRISSYLHSTKSFVNRDNTNYTYGIEVYNRLAYKIGNENEIMIRDFHLLLEHKQFMYKMITNCFDFNKLNTYDIDILTGYKKLCEEHLLLRNIYIKDCCIKTPKAENIKKIQKKLIELQEEETLYLQTLLNPNLKEQIICEDKNEKL